MQVIKYIESILFSPTGFRYLALVLVLLLTSCSGLGVKPWQRDIHAEAEMALDADSLDLAVDAHIYFSKEASSGGQGFAGGAVDAIKAQVKRRAFAR
jgi:hypothetical protein